MHLVFLGRRLCLGSRAVRRVELKLIDLGVRLGPLLREPVVGICCPVAVGRPSRKLRQGPVLLARVAPRSGRLPARRWPDVLLLRHLVGGLAAGGTRHHCAFRKGIVLEESCRCRACL